VCGTPFFPRVLIHLIGLDRRVVHGERVGGEQGLLLELVPQPQQVLPVSVQLAGQLRGGDALGDAPKDEKDLRGSAVGLLEDGLCEGVEDPATRAAVVQDRIMGPAVDPEGASALAAWAGEALRVEDGDDLLVAGVLIHELGDGEVHDRLRCSDLQKGLQSLKFTPLGGRLG
jgi:hypothetical protein